METALNFITFKNFYRTPINFNQLANTRGWTAERSYYSMALTNEIIRRGIDVSSIMEWGDRSGRLLSVRYVLVRYDEASKGLVPLS